MQQSSVPVLPSFEQLLNSRSYKLIKQREFELSVCKEQSMLKNYRQNFNISFLKKSRKSQLSVLLRKIKEDTIKNQVYESVPIETRAKDNLKILREPITTYSPP